MASSESRVSTTIRSYMGEPRGHWEGTTLVVESTHFNGRFGARGNGNNIPLSDELHVVERFSLDSKTMKPAKPTSTAPSTSTMLARASAPTRKMPLRIGTSAATAGAQ